MTLVTSRRVSMLISAADHLARLGRLDPQVHAMQIVESWKRARPESFARLALLAGMRPVGEVVQRQFIEALEGRARRVRS